MDIWHSGISDFYHDNCHEIIAVKSGLLSKSTKGQEVKGSVRWMPAGSAISHTFLKHYTLSILG